jgi:dipeptidase E
MNLYLSSMHFGANPDRLTSLLGSNKRAAICLNANDGLGSGRDRYFSKTLSILDGLGVAAEEIDLRAYFDQRQRLFSKLQQYGLLWVTGGNTFVLRRAFYASGLDQLLPTLLQNPEFTYGGFSAGACVATPSLHGIDLADDPYTIPAGYPAESPLWDGLNLVDFRIVPHFGSSLPGLATLMAEIAARFTTAGLNFYSLTDNQAIVVTPNGFVIG